MNFQSSVLFVAQDIDYIVGLMCYLQMSILGCAGYVVIGDSLLNPTTSMDGRGLFPDPKQNIWYTPFFFRDEWHWRRQIWMLSHILQMDFRQENDNTVEEPQDDPEKAKETAEDAEPEITSSDIPDNKEENEEITFMWNTTDTGQLTFL